MRIYLETFGCQMNRLDSELVEGLLRQSGHLLVADSRQADAVVYNTCSVRARAEQKVYSRLGAAAKRKAAGRRLIVAVIGCMAQREHEALAGRHPAVDVVCSPGQLYRLPELLSQAAEDESAPAVAVDPPRRRGCVHDSPERAEAFDLSRTARAGGSPQAYVRVMRGCDRFCAYCVVPLVRGPECSRNPDNIVEEVRRLVQAGRSEITLLGQTVNSYRRRNGESQVRFSDLLERVSAVAGVRRLRFVTSHPCDFGDDVLEAMRDLPNVCPYMHCPAQSGSDAVLRRMRRGYTRAQYDELVSRARQTVPGVVLAGDFIVGFPGETEDDHEASADLIRRSGYKNTFIFRYSPRPGTYAAGHLPDDVPEPVKRRRNSELLAAQEQAGLEHHRGCVGSAMEVLVEGPSVRASKQPGKLPAGMVQLSGRTRGDHIVVFDGPKELAGKYVDVKITGATSLTLFGRTPDEGA